MTRPKIAAIITAYFPRSHADVIVGKYLRGLPCDDGLHPPRVDIVSMYLDQVEPATDIGLETAREFGIPVYVSIRQALTLGGDKLAVDGVLLIGEHGDYTLNEKGQQLYPRRHLFEQIAGTLASSRRSVPIFTDKHLSYNWEDACWMVERSRDLGIPLMAGSSLPMGWRRPFVEHPLGVSLTAAVVLGYGPIESYGFHALETLQCMVERRAGGESGVRAVQCLEGAQVWRWLGEQTDLAKLANSAAEVVREKNGSWSEVRQVVPQPVAFVLDYCDGLRAAVLMVNEYCSTWAYAATTADRHYACEVYLQNGMPYAHFSYLSLNVEEMFVTGQPTYPVERTLLTTGVLAAAMESRYRGCARLPTPHLGVSYTPVQSIPYRPVGPDPSGATLDPWPPVQDR